MDLDWSAGFLNSLTELAVFLNYGCAADGFGEFTMILMP